MKQDIQQLIIKIEATYGAEAAFEVTKHLAAAWEAARKLERADEKAIRELAKLYAAIANKAQEASQTRMQP